GLATAFSSPSLHDALPISDHMTGEVQTQWARVVLDVPLPGPFDYSVSVPVAIGSRVIVPFGQRQMIGIVVALPPSPSVPADQVRDRKSTRLNSSHVKISYA